MRVYTIPPPYLGSEVLIAGGHNDSGYLSAAELYNMGNPLVTSNSATSVTTTSAILNGQIDDNGTSTTGTFNFGTTNSYGASIAAIPGTITPGSGSTAVTATKTGLTCNTSYHYRVTATNTYGTNYGADQSFTTAACATAPIATTELPTNITATSGNMNGTVIPQNATTTVTFNFGLTTSYGTNIAATPSPLSAGNTSSSVTANRSGLTCNTSYHYRVKAVSSAGTTYGEDRYLTTAACGNGSCGDVNQDGTVTMADALAVARHVTGLAVSGTCFAQ